MPDPAQTTFNTLFGPEFGHGKPLDLAQLRRALEALGAPHASLPPVFHVAGTNGKGSTIAFMRAIAEAAGLRVHAFTKPHLFALRERFVIAGETATEAALIDAAERVHRLEPGLTQFDAQVAAAFVLFGETPADLVLLETGMGGRDDSTNVIARPAASIITPIALDHQDALGGALADIAAHKAGILKRGAPAFIARQTPEVMATIEEIAECVGAPLFRCGVEWDCFASNGRLFVQTETRALDLPLPALAGAHQIDNAGLACAILIESARHAISDDAFAAGIALASWPARLQLLTRGPFSAATRARGGEVWVDAAHNAHATSALARWAAAMQSRREAPLIVIFAARARKDWAVALKPLASEAELIIAAPLAEEGVAPDAIAAAALSEGAAAQAAPSLEAAMRIAARHNAPRVLICGSFLLAAEALRLEAIT